MCWRNPDDPTKPISRLVIIHDSEPSYSFPGVTTWFPNSQVLLRDHSTHLPAQTIGSLNTHVLLTQFSRSTICPISNKLPQQGSSIPFLCTLSYLHPSHGSLLYSAKEAHRHRRSSLRIALNWTKKCYCTPPHHGKANTFASTYPVCTKRTKWHKTWRCCGCCDISDKVEGRWKIITLPTPPHIQQSRLAMIHWI